jgi:hypothetical protein
MAITSCNSMKLEKYFTVKPFYCLQELNILIPTTLFFVLTGHNKSVCSYYSVLLHITLEMPLFP